MRKEPLGELSARSLFKKIECVTRIAKQLSEIKRRSLYSRLVFAAKKCPMGGKAFELMCKIPVELNQNEKYAWHTIVESVSEAVKEYGPIFVWYFYESLLQGPQTKNLGQYFTPCHLARFALSGVYGNPASILDPMAGHGAFLYEARRVFQEASIKGVEIDRLPLIAAELILNSSFALINADIFDWTLECVTNDPGFEFDAIVGNPAYVSYQRLQEVGVFSRGMKNTQDYREHILVILKAIARKKSLSNQLRRVFANWSGYSDLSLYVLVLSWLLVPQGGQIAFIMSNHWMERRYGIEVKKFLARNGNIRGIVTQHGSGWFPRALVPTSVFVYTKGEPSDRQKELGVPYVEILDGNLDDIQRYLNSLMDNDFWSWLDEIHEPRTLGSIQVSFRRWFSQPPEPRLRTSKPKASWRTIQIPDYLSSVELTSFERAGWEVHQGLRTGCNEVFYVHKTSKSPNSSAYVTSVTRNGEVREKEIEIPEYLLIPTIKKLSSKSCLIIGPEATNTYLLNLEEAILRNDLKRVKDEYPYHWIEAWKLDNIRLIPQDVEKHLNECASLPYEGKGQPKKPARELSAVRTNVYVPPKKMVKNIPHRPRFWYQIKIQPRHFGRIFIPRVSAGPLRSYLVKKGQQLVIDANFVTLIPDHPKIGAKLLWIWLNSNSFRYLTEMNAVAMGGGALKTEATTVKKIPIPQTLLISNSRILENTTPILGSEILSDDKLIEEGRKIDEVLFGVDIAQFIQNELFKRIEYRLKGKGI